MMNNPKYSNLIKIFFPVTAILLLIILWQWQTSNSTSKNNIPTIGVIQVVEHPALDRTRQGVLDELLSQGYKPEKTMQWLYESAQGNPTLATQIAQKLVGQNVKLIVAIGTMPAQAVAKATKRGADGNIPVVFASVTDPLEAKLIPNLKAPGDNVSGVSNFVEVNQQFDLFKKIIPSLKNIGIIYNPGEANSVSLVELMQKAAQLKDLNLVLMPASKTSEVSAAAQGLIGKVDAIFINNDNTALSAFDAIFKVALERKIPVFSSDTDMLAKGALAALGPDQYQIGRQAGRMVVKILRGQAAPATISVEFPQIVELCLNLKVAEQLMISVPKDLIKEAKNIIQP